MEPPSLSLKHVEKDGEHFVIPETSSSLETFGKGSSYEGAMDDLRHNVKMMSTLWGDLQNKLSGGEGIGYTTDHVRIDTSNRLYVCIDCDKQLTQEAVEDNDDRCPVCESADVHPVED